MGSMLFILVFIEARRSRHTSATEDSLQQRTVPPQMPPRKNVVIAPRSPLEFEGDSDYEGKEMVV